ncbi:MAG: hypothetical protein R3F49_07945 [Planctomycetota bacterium]
MEIRSLTGVVLSLAAPALGAQVGAEVSWEHVRAPHPQQGLQPMALEATPDGGMLVLGWAQAFPLGNPNQPGTFELAKLSENGDVVWTDSVAAGPVAPSLQHSTDRRARVSCDDVGNAYVILRGTTSVLRRYAVDGTLEWSVDLPLLAEPAGATDWSDYAALFVATASSGDAIVVGAADQGTYPRVDVRVFAPDGTPRWDWRGNGGLGPWTPAMGYPRGVLVGNNDSVYVMGQFDTLTNFRDLRVTAIDSAGVYLWTYNSSSASEGANLDGAFDSQGNLVIAHRVLGANNTSEATVSKLDANGNLIFESGVVAPNWLLIVTSVAIDPFDQITVGGSTRAPSSLVREAGIFRFAADGTALGFTAPSVATPSVGAEVSDLAVTHRGDVLAFGAAGAGPDGVFLARIAPDGTERWALRRRGTRPPGAASGGLSLTVDSRGNPLTLASLPLGGVSPNLSLGLDVVKHLQDGAAGQAYCTPAAANSTGASAGLRALGPSLLAADNVTLLADGLPPGALALFLASRHQSLVPGAGGGQGTLCLGSSIGRYYGPGEIRIAGAEGAASVQLHLDHLPQPGGRVSASIGETWNFQAWYRDTNPGPTSNLTHGVSVLFQ